MAWFAHHGTIFNACSFGSIAKQAFASYVCNGKAGAGQVRCPGNDAVSIRLLFLLGALRQVFDPNAILTGTSETRTPLTSPSSNWRNQVERCGGTVSILAISPQTVTHSRGE